MTVKELKDILSDFPEDMRVMYQTNNGNEPIIYKGNDMGYEKFIASLPAPGIDIFKSDDGKKYDCCMFDIEWY